MTEDRVPTTTREMLFWISQQMLNRVADANNRDAIADIIEEAGRRWASAQPAPPLDQRAAIDYAVHLMEEAFEGAAPVHAVAIRRHIEVITSLSEQPAPPLDVERLLTALRSMPWTFTTSLTMNGAEVASRYARLGSAPSTEEARDD